MTWKQIEELDDNWDSYGAEKPSCRSIENARKFVNWLHKNKMEESNILSSAEGGVGVCFYGECTIEFLNDGTIEFCYSNPPENNKF